MGNIQQYLWLGMGGFVGTIARFALSELAIRRLGDSFPYGTLSVNLIGSFVIGILAILLTQPFLSHLNFRLFLVVGLMGGFTTYSSFSLDIFRLLKSGSVMTAFYYVIFTLFTGLLLTFLGALTGDWIVKRL
jgi:CrcB protein